MLLYKNFTPLVSVILPTYNRKNYLERSVISVINQDMNDWELIIVDDGGNDDSFEFVKSVQNDHDNIKYVRHSNRKLPLTMNTGIQISYGKYMAFLGDDDEFKSNHLSLRTKFMETYTELDLLYGGVEIVGNPYVKDKNDLTKQIHISECALGGTFFGKREAFLRLKGFNNVKYSEDSELLERAKEFLNVQEVSWETYIYYRDTPNSICTTITD